ncbi:hypothetical protein G7007_07665 [Pseudomonas entomophila]|jgi:uncharacterized lipoprotein YbaY|uniref:YbaY family lipoprotein n=1 Tax=Pseudomonas entomophila TaxID=312306 RepID=UPI0015E3830F|nr:YbaY family lipoprotein [Pseudomonas entomophila]MBA1192736.1 hypothetical protein [Pseudomonas entomophila]
MSHPLSQLTLDVVYPGPIRFPDDTFITCALEDGARADASAIVHACHTIRCAGVPPSSLVLQFDPRTVDARSDLGIRIRVESKGNVMLVNDEHVPVVLPATDCQAPDVTEALRLGPIAVKLVATQAGVTQGIHGGNLMPEHRD